VQVTRQAGPHHIQASTRLRTELKPAAMFSPSGKVRKPAPAARSASVLLSEPSWPKKLFAAWSAECASAALRAYSGGFLEGSVRAGHASGGGRLGAAAQVPCCLRAGVRQRSAAERCEQGGLSQ